MGKENWFNAKDLLVGATKFHQSNLRLVSIYNFLKPNYLMKLVCSIVTFLLYTANILVAQTDSTTVKKKKWPFTLIQKLQEGNVRFVPIPAFSVSPEKGISGGLILEYFFNTSTDSAKKNTRLSNAYVNLQYSTLNQAIIEGVYSVYTPKEKFFLQGAFGYRDFYERYWTLSEDTVANDQYIGIDYKQVYIRGKWLKNLKNQFFWGIGFTYNSFNDIQYQNQVYPSLPNVSGLTQSTSAGLGPIIIFDKRDNQFSPQKGWFAEAGIRFHDKFLGANFNFTQYNFDIRRYIVTTNKAIIALHATATLNDGNVPFLEKVKMGNDKIMRGYFAGRFRDYEFIAAQAEYRYPLSKSIVLACFMSAGQTAPTINSLNTNDFQTSAGGGIRYLVNKDKRLYVRFDAGYTQKGNWGFYLNLGDAF